MSETKVVKSRVREYIGEDTRMSADVYDALDEAVGEIIDDAIERAQANNRKTIQAHDV